MLLLSGFSLGCIALIFLIVARDFWQHSVAKAFLAMLVSASALLIRPHLDVEYRSLASDVMTMLPALFWLVCQLAFASRPQIRSVWAILALYSFIAPAVTRNFLESTLEPSGTLTLLGWRLPQFCEYIIILNGLWAIVASWQDDLIDSRRKLRAAMLIVLGSTGLWVTVSLNTGIGGSVSMFVGIAICSFVVGFLLLQGREGVLLGLQKEKPLVSSPEVNEDSTALKQKSELKLQAAKLEKVMDDEKFYRTEKLTLSMLAEEIGLPEYKTRALINQTFNYRNFNDYVNQLRIEEASDRLSDEPDTPIQNIALDIGYRTLSSFNRAFKDIMDQTPSEYRLSKRS